MDEAAMEKRMERGFKKQVAEANSGAQQYIEEIRGTLDEQAAKIAAAETTLQHATAKASGRTPSRSESATPAPGQGSTGSARSTTAAGDDNDWGPQVVHIKGFAPFGCEVGQKLQRAEVAAELAHMRDLLPQELADCVGDMRPHTINQGTGDRRRAVDEDGGKFTIHKELECES